MMSKPVRITWSVLTGALAFLLVMTSWESMPILPRALLGLATGAGLALLTWIWTDWEEW